MAMADVEGQFAGSELVLQQADTRAFVDGRELGSGLLRVEESNLCWSSENQSESLCLHYPSISIHAISRDTTSFPHHCVYLMYCPPGEENMELGEEGKEMEEEEVEGCQMSEIRLVPPESDHLQPIYQAITHCQTLYPDPELSDEEEGEEEEEEEEREGEGEGEGVEENVDLHSGEFFTSPEGLQFLSAQGQATLAHLERVLQLPTPQEFESMVSNGEGAKETQDHQQEQFEDAD